MANGEHTDSKGNFHDENGKFVSLRDFVERIFAERESSAEFKRIALKEALDEAKATTERALQEAKTNVEEKLEDAKDAADERERVLQARLDKLESGGAPFANRLDEGVNKLRGDVDVLNTEAVRTKVLDALRLQQVKEANDQRKQTKAALIAAGVAILVTVIQFVANLVSTSPQP